MSQIGIPYIQQCAVCGDGLIRIHRCGACDGIIAVCDECELTWTDCAAIRNDAKTESDGAYPVCPECDEKGQISQPLPKDEITYMGLGILIAGQSK